MDTKFGARSTPTTDRMKQEKIKSKQAELHHVRGRINQYERRIALFKEPPGKIKELRKAIKTDTKMIERIIRELKRMGATPEEERSE